MSRLVLAALVAAALISSFGLADPPLTVPAADGSDGAFNPTSNTTIDLSLAVNGDWDASVQRTPGVGIYDARNFAVVFRYSSVNIPAGVGVAFKNHSPNAPVVWIVRDSVTFGGWMHLYGSTGTGSNLTLSKPGPGGFPGGRGWASGGTAGSSGFGPGAGRSSSAEGSSAGYRTDAPDVAGSSRLGRVYGNWTNIPLIGGSGGGASAIAPNLGGGAGGGAILIVCQGTITLLSASDPWLSADGNIGDGHGGNGSGGAIRLVSNRIEGSARIYSHGNGNPAGSNGRIIVEAFDNVATIKDYDGSINREVEFGVPSNPAQIWPASDAPVVQITKINGVSVSTTPIGDILNNRSDLSIAQPAPVPIEITTYNVPLIWHVRLHVTSKSGGDAVDPNKPEATPPASCPQAGPCVWTLTTTIPPGYVSLLARASVN